MKATAKQKQLIHVNCPTRDIKEEFVQWATEDVKKISTNDLTFDQANMILEKLGKKPHRADNWGLFDKNNPKHMKLMSLLRTAQWTVKNDKYGEVADTGRLSDWLKSKLSPVQKPLKKMEPEEVEKVITAFSGIVKSKYK